MDILVLWPNPPASENLCNKSMDFYFPQLLRTFSLGQKKVKIIDLWLARDIPHMHQLYHFKVDWMICAAGMLLISLSETYLIWKVGKN